MVQWEIQLNNSQLVDSEPGNKTRRGFLLSHRIPTFQHTPLVPSAIPVLQVDAGSYYFNSQHYLPIAGSG